MTETEATQAAGIAVDLKDAAVLGLLGNSRTYHQYKSMYDHFAAGICPFCNLELLKYPVIHRIGNWALKKNDMPYSNCEHHLVIVYAGGHLTDWKKLTREEKADFWDLVDWAEEHLGIDGCGIAARRGNPARHAGTISHIHAHIQVVRLDSDGLPVGGLRAYFAKTREELEHCKKMVELFEKVRQGEVTGFTRIHKGLIVFKEGSYLSCRMDHWQKHDQPEWAEIITSPLKEISAVIQEDKDVQVYEAMQTAETGPVLMNGPVPFYEYLRDKAA